MILSPSDQARFERFLKRDEASGCLIYTGSRDTRGYGRFNVGGVPEKASRIAWFLAGKELTADRPLVLHNCPCGDNPACCEIGHLWAGSFAENAMDMARKGRGRKSPRGLPPGVKLRHGRYLSRFTFQGRDLTMGTYDSWAVASALAALAKNLVIFPGEVA